MYLVDARTMKMDKSAEATFIAIAMLTRGIEPAERRFPGFPNQGKRFKRKYPPTEMPSIPMRMNRSPPEDSKSDEEMDVLRSCDSFVPNAMRERINPAAITAPPAKPPPGER